MKGAGELKRLVLPSTRRQWEQTYIDHLNPRIIIIIIFTLALALALA